MASSRELREEIKEELQGRKSHNRGLSHKRQSLLAAIKEQNLEKVERLLNQGVDPNFRDNYGSYPLHLACAADVDGNTSVAESIVELLLYMDADPEVQDRFSHQPLHIAATTSHRLVQVLLEKGCSINAQDNAGSTALLEACYNNCNDPLDTVTLLLQHNANVHLADEYGFTALHCICDNTVVDTTIRNKIALLLLNSGLSATVCDTEGRMALCHELQKMITLSYRIFQDVDLQLVETLVCAGSNLLHNTLHHQYWARYCINTVNPKVLSRLLLIVSPVLTRPCLRMINKLVTELYANSEKEADAASFKTQVHNMSRTVDSLQSICRRSVRANLRGKMLVGVPQLPLPNRLKNFLKSLEIKPS